MRYDFKPAFIFFAIDVGIILTVAIVYKCCF